MSGLFKGDVSGARIRAKFRGKCRYCTGVVQVGDPVRALGDGRGVAHEKCFEEFMKKARRHQGMEARSGGADVQG